MQEKSVAKPWEKELGHHRARVKVTDKADAVWAHLSWRRPDPAPGKKNPTVIDAATGQPVKNRVIINANREFGDIVFQPVTAPGEYYIYYMPYKLAGWTFFPTTEYQTPQDTAEQTWLKQNRLTTQDLLKDDWRSLPQAEVVAFEAIRDLERFVEMETIATLDEVNQLLAKYPNQTYLVFPEDRRFPIRMSKRLPHRWIQNGPAKLFQGKAQRNEYYAFQLGVYAARSALPNVRVQFEDLCLDGQSDQVPPSARLAPKGGIPASSLTCFNLGGIDGNGQPFTKTVSVDLGHTQALWFGIDIPRDAVPGQYQGGVILSAQGNQPQRIELRIEVSKDVLEDRGDSETWRHSRMRWLNSTIAGDDEVVPPFTPLKVSGQTINCLGRSVTLKPDGLPKSIKSFFSPSVTRLQKSGREILAGPIEFIVESMDGKIMRWQTEMKFTKKTPGVVAWSIKAHSGPLTITGTASMEFDGCLEYKLDMVTSEKRLEVKDIRLEIPIRRDVAKYAMGMGIEGGYRPPSLKWSWDSGKQQDSLWLGDVNAGLRCQLRGLSYYDPITSKSKQKAGLPETWDNWHTGGCDMTEEGDDRVVIRPRTNWYPMKSTDTLRLYFGLMITPFKLLDTDAYWQNRFCHGFFGSQEAVDDSGANVFVTWDSHINYSFFSIKDLKGNTDRAHEYGTKMRLYYTTREVSNYMTELWAMLSLDNEIFPDGAGGGAPWLNEHIREKYIPAWFQPGPDDAAICTAKQPRWHNYYLEGVNWYCEHMGVDGLYIDDTTMDRTVMRRARKILASYGPGKLIDLHSNNRYTQGGGGASSINLYMELLPYIDRLWFGEAYYYNKVTPDNWLIEISGIPFGIMNEMLGSGNPFRGMIYGETARHAWLGADPRPIWNVWKDFGIEGSEMLGYWDPNCPVKTDNKDVLVTVYRKPDKVLIALASWAEKTAECRLKINWSELGFGPKNTQLRAPEIRNTKFGTEDKPKIQKAGIFKPTASFKVKPQGGRLLILEKK